MATTIESLPFELLELILLYAVADASLGTSSSSSSSLAARNRFLREASLLSRTLRYPAQAVLWSSIRVHSAGAAKRLLASPVLGQFGTRQLDLVGVSGGDGLSGTTAARVLGKLRSVQVLRLADFGRLSAKVLQSETLNGLRTLLLLTSFPEKSAVFDNLTLPFHLHSLYLFNRSYPPALLNRIFSASANSLTSLTLHITASSPTYSALVDALPVVATNLRHLSLQHRPSVALVSQFPFLTSLRRLDCHFSGDFSPVLDSLPLPLPGTTPLLSHLVIELDYNLGEVATAIASRLLDSKGVLSGLKVLSIPRAPALESFGEYGGMGLIEACEEKGVSLEVGTVVEWRTRSLFD